MRNSVKLNRKIAVILALALVALLWTATSILAQVTGPCVGCHTMHNSQDGVQMAVDQNGQPAGPYAKLLRRDGCLGCHKGDYSTSGSAIDAIPKVFSDTAPTTGTQDYSAGGDFYWVAQAGTAADKKGHNVGYVKAPDGNFGSAPTFPPGYDNTIIGPGAHARGPFTVNDVPTQLTCAGTLGCHGDPNVANDFGALTGAHHGVENAGGFSDGSTIAKSYRFLYGIKGVESSDWEHTLSPTNHNQYHGDNRNSNTATDNTTISHLCCECHGLFHTAGDASFASPWIRHPTDFDLTNATGTEYASYNIESGSVGEYSTLAPVASDMGALTATADGTAQIVSDIFGTPPTGVTDIAIVTCISCHRAHGSEYDDLLRWDYVAGTSAGSGTNTDSGCFVCHTTKDDN